MASQAAYEFFFTVFEKIFFYIIYFLNNIKKMLKIVFVEKPWTQCEM